MNSGKTDSTSKRTSRALALLLSFLMVFSILAVNIPSAFAEEELQPTETVLPSGEPQQSEEPQTTEEPQPSGEPQTTEEPQPSGEPQTTEEPQPSEELPQDTTGTAGGRKHKADVPEILDKSKLTGPQKKLSTALLQLTDDKFLLNGKTKKHLINEMKQRKQVKITSTQISKSSITEESGVSETKVHVYIKLEKGASFDILSPFESGKVNRDTENRFEAAWVSIDSLERIASLSGVQSIREVTPPVVRTGSITSQGDSVLKALDMRSQTGSDGTGIKIGIISDGVDHWAESKATGDLPADFTAANILRNSLGGDEGTAMMEIVYDLAPGAKLYFRDAGNDIIDFNNGIDALVNAGCDIICDDVGWITEPYFEDGPVAQHVANVLAAQNIIYVTAAGNDADRHYQGSFWNDGYSFHDFSRGTDEDFPYLYVDIPPGEDILVYLQWDDKFGQSGNDYDLRLYDYYDQYLVAFSNDVQNGNGDPIEGIYYYNYDEEFDAYLEIDVYKAPLAPAKNLELFIFGGDLESDNLVPEDSIYGHAAVPGVITCGAVGQAAPTIVENYSSRGPVTMLTETRYKPDICGVDMVAVTGVGGLSKPFSGTSAAAPHIAAIAALLKSRFPAISNAQIKTILNDNADYIGTSGSGNGRANALKAALSYLYVTFDSQGGSAVGNQLVAREQKAARPADPKKTGYIFGGWYTDIDFTPAYLWNFNNAVTADTKLYAKWVKNIVTISANGTYDLRNYENDSIININNGLTVTLTTGDTPCNDIQVVCGQGVTLTADYLNIVNSGYPDSCPISFTGSGNSLILASNCHLESGNGSPAIRVEQGSFLTISGPGGLYAYPGSSSDAAAIGGRSGYSCGNITITGGTIDANGYNGAGIGGGYHGGGGNITITGGTIDANGSPGAGLGGGSGGPGGNISITGGTVSANGSSQCDIGYGYGGSGGTLSISGSSAILLRHGTSVTPATSTHTKRTLSSAPGGIIYGKIPVPSGWAAPYYIYVNNSEISTLTFNANGGAGTVPASVTQYIGTALAVPGGGSLVKNRLAFVSWNTQANGLGENYAPGSPYTFDATDALYAKYAEPVHVTSVEISGGEGTMIDGGTQTLAAAVLPADATYPEVTWSSGNEAAATVDQNGVVTAVFPGTATITAAADGVSDTFDITVVKKPVTSIEISSDSETMADSYTLTLTAAVLPPDATYNDIAWSSDNEAAATVDENGVVTAVFPGTATITAAADGLSDTCEITVEPLRVTDVMFSSGEVNIGIGKTKAMTVSVLPAGATYPELTWESDNETVATVDGEGNVTAHTFGSARITATADGVSGTCTVNVKCEISALPNDPVLGSVSGAGFYLMGDEAALTAIPAEGCRFVRWTEGGAGVSAGKVYTFTAEGNRALVAEFIDIGIPEAEAGRAAYNSVNLTWNPLGEATGYEVWRGASAAGTYSFVKDLAETSYTDEGLTSGTTYYYKVRGYYKAGNDTDYGLFSDAVSARPVTFAPAGVKAGSAGYSSVKVTWSAADGAAGYQLYRSTSEGGTYSLVKTTPSLYYTDSGLTTGKQYYYKVRAYAVTISAAGDYSEIVSAVPLPAQAAYAKAIMFSSTSNKLIWDQVAGASGYEIIFCDPAGNALAGRNNVTTTEVYYFDINLTPNIMYYYKVVAYRTVSGVRKYGVVSPLISAMPEFGSVERVNAAAYSASSNKIIWSAVSGRTGYDVWRCDQDGSNAALLTSPGAAYTGTYWYDKNLAPNRIYYYFVKAYVNVSGSKYYKETAEPSVVSAAQILGDVTGVKAVQYTLTSAKISWKAVAGRSGYEVQMCDSEGLAIGSPKTTAYTYYTWTGLTYGKVYYFKVRAYVNYTGGPGYSENYSDIVSIEAGLKPLPGVKAAAYSATKVKLIWSPVSYMNGYAVMFCGADGNQLAGTNTVTTGNTYYYDSDLIPGTVYYYRVCAYRLVGAEKDFGPWSGVVSAAPELADVKGVKGYAYSTTANKIYWDKVWGCTGYEVTPCDSEGNSTDRSAVTTTSTYCYDKSLIGGETYYYKVRAYAKHTDGSKVYSENYSGLVSVTAGLRPAAGAKAVMYNATQVKLTWQSVPYMSGYEVSFYDSEGIPTGRAAVTTANTYYYDKGLATNETYYYMVRAYRGPEGSRIYGPYSKLLSAALAFNTPEGVKAEPATLTSVKVSWKAAAGAAGYRIQMCDSEGNPAGGARTTAGTYYTWPGLTAGTLCYFKVCAYEKSTGETGYTPYSGLVSAKPGLKRVTGASAAPYNATTVKLTWKSVTYMTNYEIWVCDSEGEALSRTGTTVSTYYYIKNLEPGAAYYYKVRAYRTGGYYGDYSALLTAELRAFGPPVSVKADPYDITAIKVSWSKVWGASGYEVWRYDAAAGDYVKIKTTSSTYYCDRYHKLGDSFSYKVLAYSGGKKTALSAAAAGGPGLIKVTGAKAAKTGVMSVKVSWNYVPYKSGYEIWRCDTADGVYEKFGTSTGTYWYDCWGNAGKTYYYKVRAYRVSGGSTYYGGFSGVVSATA